MERPQNMADACAQTQFPYDIPSWVPTARPSANFAKFDCGSRHRAREAVQITETMEFQT